MLAHHGIQSQSFGTPSNFGYLPMIGTRRLVPNLLFISISRSLSRPFGSLAVSSINDTHDKRLPSFLVYRTDGPFEPLHLADGEVHVWWLRHSTQTTVPGLREVCSSLLTEVELAECSTISDSGTRELRLLARAFSRSVLAQYVNASADLPAETWPSSLKFSRNDYGKPKLESPLCSSNLRPLHFNLTHTRGLIGIAVTRGREIGLDAEPLSRKPKGGILPLARRWLSRLEIEQLSGTFIVTSCISSFTSHAFKWIRGI